MPSDDVLVLIDESGRVIEWGPQAEDLFGWSAEEALGHMVTALIREAERRGNLPDAALLVKPVVRGAALVWQLLTAEDATSGQDAAILKAVFTHSPMRLYVLDHRLCVVRMSTVTGEDDPSEQHVLGTHFLKACGFSDPEEEATVAQRVLERGEPVMNRLVRRVKAPGRPMHRVYSVSYFRLEDGDGTVVGLVIAALDVTERENSRNRLVLLDTFRTRVGHLLNVMVVCREMVEAVVPAFAGIAEVEVIEDVVRGEDPPPVPVRQDILLRRAAFRGKGTGPAVGVERPLPIGSPFSEILSDLRPRLVKVDGNSPWLTADPARADVIRRSGAHSMIVAPLSLRGHALGLVSFYRYQQEDPFEEEDVVVASAMCAHAALCMENARQFMREWITARTVQHRLLPHRPVTHGTAETSQLHIPDPEGGGAWSDAIALPGARTALIVGDVAGKGIAAAITMGLLRTAIHTLVALDLQPDELLARLSDTTARLAAARATLPADPVNREPLTAGCAIAIYDPVDLTCTLARAGLPDPIVVYPDGTSAPLCVPEGPPLAEPGSAPFPAITVGLPEGTTLAMGTSALADELLTPPGSLSPFLEGVGTKPLHDVRDDIARTLTASPRTGETLMLLARTKTLPQDRVLTRDLPADPQAAPIARAAARRQLEVWDVDEETAFTTELIVSELVGNAVRYGAPPLQLRLIFERMLTCEVSDTTPSSPQVKHARTVDETGRGLFIIASLADQWGTHYRTRGKTVWAEQSAGSTTELPERDG